MPNKKAAKTSEIAQAALAVFLNTGYAQTGIEQIAQ